MPTKGEIWDDGSAGVPQDPGYRPDRDKDLEDQEPYDVEAVRSSRGFLIMGIMVALLDCAMIYGWS